MREVLGSLVPDPSRFIFVKFYQNIRTCQRKSTPILTRRPERMRVITDWFKTNYCLRIFRFFLLRHTLHVVINTRIGEKWSNLTSIFTGGLIHYQGMCDIKLSLMQNFLHYIAQLHQHSHLVGGVQASGIDPSPIFLKYNRVDAARVGRLPETEQVMTETVL